MKTIRTVAAVLLAAVMLLPGLTGCGKETGDVPAATAKKTETRTSSAAETELVFPDNIPGNSGFGEDPIPNTFTVLKSHQSESLMGGEDASPLYQTRKEAFLAQSNFILTETVTGTLQATVTAGYLSGETYDLLLLKAVPEGSALFAAGVLQDVSAAGIGITAVSSCAIPTLAEELLFDGKLYLLPCRGLLSDISSTFCLSVKNGTMAWNAVRNAVANGTYTLETILTYFREWEETDPELFEEEINTEDYRPFEVPALGGGSKGMEGLLSALDGRVLLPGTLPQDNTSSKSFAEAFNATSGVAGYFTDGEENLCVTLLSERNVENRTVFPLPVLSSANAVLTPVDADGLTVVAACAGGFANGQKTAELLQLFSDLSFDLRKEAQTLPDDPGGKTAAVLFTTQHLELGKIYSWGNLFDFTFERLGEEGYAGFSAQSTLKSRRAAFAASADIIQQKYK